MLWLSPNLAAQYSLSCTVFGGFTPPPPPSPRAEGLLAPAAGYLIAGSGEKQRSASRPEAPAPPPSRCRHRNRPVRHHKRRYPLLCDTSPSDPPAPADCSSHMHTRSTTADPLDPHLRSQDRVT